jgi:hypothetical protein
MPDSSTQTDGFIYGLDEFYFNGIMLGYISEEGLQPGGEESTTTSIRAAQAKNAVVKNILTTPGVDRFTFTLIELKLANIVPVFGGTVADGVYTAPRTKAAIEGRGFIKCFSGHKIDIPKGMLTSNLAGSISLAGVLSIACKMDVSVPDDEDKGPFSIYDPGKTVPDDPSVAPQG